MSGNEVSLWPTLVDSRTLLPWLAILSILVGVAMLFSSLWSDDYDRIERSAHFREDALNDLRNIEKPYIKLLEAALEFCNKVWGPLDSFQPLGSSIVYALFYSLLIFVGAWTFGGPGNIGSTVLLADLAQDQRYIFTGTLLTISVFIITGIVFSRQIQRFSIKTISQALRIISSVLIADEKICYRDYSVVGRAIFYILGCSLIFVIFLLPPYFHSGLKVFQIYLILGLGTPFIATILAGYWFERVVPILVAISLIGAVFAYTPLFYGNAIPSAVAIISTVGFGAAFILSRTDNERIGPTGVMTGTISGVGITGAIGGAFVGYLVVSTRDFSVPLADPAIVSILLFLIFLPLINGVVDWGSLSVSRFLGKVLSNILTDPNRKPAITMCIVSGFVIVDLVVAVVLLWIMTVGLTGTIQIYNRSALQVLPVPPLSLEQLISNVESAPLGLNGIWVTCMLFSTLVPTFGHFIFVLFASFVTWRPSTKTLDDLDETFSSGESVTKIRAYRKLARLMTLRRLMRTSAGLGLFLLVLLLVLYAVEVAFHITVADWLAGNARLVIQHINNW